MCVKLSEQMKMIAQHSATKIWTAFRASSLVICLVCIASASKTIAADDVADLLSRAETTPLPPDTRPIAERVTKNSSGAVTRLRLDFVELRKGDLEAVATCTNLESLSLCDTNVADEDLKHLIGLPNLKHLQLNRTQVGDAGLKHVAQIKSLKSVCLARVVATPDGVKQLLRQRPRLGIGYQRPKAPPGTR
jgi:hypothetical protein